MDPTGIVDLIKSGGPAGAGVALIWLFVPKAREAYQTADASTKPMMRFTEPLCWLCGIVMILLSVYLYSRPSQEIRGELSYLKGEQSLWPIGDNVPFYFSKNNRPGTSTKSVAWIVLGDRIKEGDKIPLSIIGSRNDPDRLFQMEMLSEFYDGKNIEMTLDFPKTVTLAHGKTKKTLELTADANFLAPTPVKASLWDPATVHAASTATSPAEQIKLLEMDDPDARKKARDSIVRSPKEAALPVIDSVAKDPARSYRAWLGALTVLNQNTAIHESDLTPAVLHAMVESLVTPGTDVSIIGQAKGYMIAHSTAEIETALRAEFKERSGGGAKPADIYELTDAFFGVLYNMGIHEKDQYQGPDVKSQAHLKAATDKFAEAWALKPWAAPWHVVQYPKAFYGWALALKDKDALDARARGSANKAESDAARDKFAEFLKQAQATSYPSKYAGQLTEAKAYISQHP